MASEKLTGTKTVSSQPFPPSATATTAPGVNVTVADTDDLTEDVHLLYGGRYELLDLVGAGGAGTVYRARDLELDEIVALKVLRKEITRSASVLERFRSEVKLARRVTHRNVARMFDIGEHEGERFLTMEFLEGEMLSGLIFAGPNGRSRPLEMSQLLDVIQQMSAGLTAAHTVGVIHRDLKPDNVIVGKDGRVVITDFGIAQALQPSETSTAATGEFIGTPEYMSPEQAEGGAIDLRTDIYSLGVMVYEMLTGHLPFSGSTPLVIAAARLLKPPPDPRQRRPEIPELVSQVVLRALARNRQDRYSSAAELAEALGDAVRTTAGIDTSREAASASSQSAPGSAANPATMSGELRLPTGNTSLTHQSALDSPARLVAVLPFRNQGPPADSYLADGISEELTDSLSMVKGLKVRSRGALKLAAATAGDDSLALGRAAGVEVIVEGTVRRIGESLRVTARLVEVADGNQVWAQRFDRPAADALQVSDEVAQAVAGALQSGAVAPRRAALDDAHAVDLYLRARALYQRGDSDALLESIHLFEQALTIRGNDPTLLTGYAMALARRWFFGGERSGELARLATERALAAAPERAEPHLAMGTLRFHLADAAGAVRELKEAIKRAPGLAEAYELIARILLETGPLPAAQRYLKMTFDIDARAGRLAMDIARMHALHGEWDEAEQTIIGGFSAGVASVGLWIARSRFLCWRGDRQLALATLDHPDLRQPALSRPKILVELAAGIRNLQGRQLFDQVPNTNASSPRARCFFGQIQCELSCLFGDTDGAIRFLARAVDAGLFDLQWLDHCQLLKPLHTDLRFHALRKLVVSRATQVQEALRS